MKNFALLLLFAFTAMSFSDADNGRLQGQSEPVRVERDEEMCGRDLGKQLRRKTAGNSEIFKDSSKEEGNLKKKMIEKVVGKPKKLSEDKREKGEMLKALRKKVACATEESESLIGPKIHSFYRNSQDVSKVVSTIPAPRRGISMDLNLHQVKDLLEEEMGSAYDSPEKEAGPGAELEGELVHLCAFGKGRCTPEKVRFRGKTSHASNKTCCHRRHKRRKDKDLQILDEMMDEMLGLPCGGGKDGMAEKPVLYCGVGKLRTVRRKSRNHCKGSEAPVKTSCSPIPRRHKPSDLDLEELNQLLDGMMAFAGNEETGKGRKLNEIEKKIFKFCATGKPHRMHDLTSKTRTASSPFNKTVCNGGEDVQCQADLNFEEVNVLMEEVMEFAGEKEKTSPKTEDLQDWLYGTCGFGKSRRLSFDSVPYRKKTDAHKTPSRNPLEAPEEHKRRLLNKMEVYLEEMLGYDCKGDKEDEVATDERISGLVEYCGFGKGRFLPENYFLDHKSCDIAKPPSCGIQQSLGDPMKLSLKQVSGLLEEMMGLPRGGVVAEVGEGLFFFCGLLKLQILSETSKHK